MGSCRIAQLQVEHYQDPLGIQHPKPRLSWTLTGGPSNWKQCEYRVDIKRTRGDTETYQVTSDQSRLVPWPSSPLGSKESANVQISVYGSNGEWTEPRSFKVEAGLLERTDWREQPVTCPAQPPNLPKRPFCLRKHFHTERVGKARLYVTALGVYECYINGQRVGHDVLAPGWTSYYARIPYQTYDVTHLLKPGENVLGAWVAEGWYAGRLGYNGGKRNIYGPRPALLCQLELDGIATKSTAWEWRYGAIVASELYDGEIYDARLPDAEFSSGDDWQNAEVIPIPENVELFASQSPPARAVRTVKAKEIIMTPSGKTIVDFGQNLAGVVRLLSEVPSESEEVILRHAEVLEHGELGTRPLRMAKATDRIITGSCSLKGHQARFTTHGFRYVEVTGWPGLTIEDLEAVVLQSAMPETGNFSCSHELINQLYSNCAWSTRGNTLSVPTDCPQRDERLGWTGDICVFAPTMSYMYDTSGFLGEWLKDLALDQKRAGGIVPIFSPDPQTERPWSEAIWGDAAVLVPYDVYQASGDSDLLLQQFTSICSWLDHGVIRDNETQLWSREEDQLADWLAPSASPQTPNIGPTDNYLVADAWLIYSTRKAVRIAKIIGQEEIAKRYSVQADQLTKSFYQEYVTASGRLVGETQTALCLLLHYNIFPETSKVDHRSKFSRRLAELVQRANWQVDTGFAGTPIVLQTLADNGHLEHAYRMLQASRSPSWLAPVLLGATTIWERWDSMLVDGTINPGEMTSFNHYALGSVASFMYEYIAGLRPVEPGWRKALVKPQPGGTITSAQASHISPYGRYAVEWEVQGGELRVAVVVPPNGSASIDLPGKNKVEVGSGSHSLTVPFSLPHFPPDPYKPHFAPVRSNEWV